MRIIFLILFVLTPLVFNAQNLKGKIIDTLIFRFDTQEFDLKLINQSSKKVHFLKAKQNKEFEVKNLEKGNYTLQILNEDYKLNVFKIDLNKNLNRIFYADKYCKYRINKSKICPRCKSDKEVIPIFYGLMPGNFMKVNKEKYYFAGCEITPCDPKWFCKKDKTQF